MQSVVMRTKEQMSGLVLECDGSNPRPLNNPSVMTSYDMGQAEHGSQVELHAQLNLDLQAGRNLSDHLVQPYHSTETEE